MSVNVLRSSQIFRYVPVAAKVSHGSPLPVAALVAVVASGAVIVGGPFLRAILKSVGMSA